MITIEAKVKKLIAKINTNADIEQIFPDTDFVEDLGIDSLSIIELVMAIEDAFEIEIDNNEAEKLRTVKNIIDFVEAKS